MKLRAKESSMGLGFGRGVYVAFPRQFQTISPQLGSLVGGKNEQQPKP